MCSAAHAWVGLSHIVYASSSEQLTAWRREWGIQPGPVAPFRFRQSRRTSRSPALTLFSLMRSAPCTHACSASKNPADTACGRVVHCRHWIWRNIDEHRRLRRCRHGSGERYRAGACRSTPCQGRPAVSGLRGHAPERRAHAAPRPEVRIVCGFQDAGRRRSRRAAGSPGGCLARCSPGWEVWTPGTSSPPQRCRSRCAASRCRRSSGRT
jgi:hypothetical protein